MNETCTPNRSVSALRRSLHACGTEVELHLVPAAGREEAARSALRRAVRWLRDAERRLSRFDPASEISRVNRAAGTPTPVSQLTFAVIEAALVAADGTRGLFDPTVERALTAAGYDRSFEKLSEAPPALAAPWSVGTPGGYRDVTLDRRARTVHLPADVGLDLGGIAKGWLADRLAERLAGYGDAVADLGGDLALAGGAAEQPWEIEVADPFGDGVLGILRASAGGVATSGVTRRRWRTAGGEAHHLIDPRTGRPARTDLASVTIVAPSAVEAEVAAKVILLLGSGVGGRAVEVSHGLGAVLVGANGEITIRGAISWQPAA